MEQIGEAVQYFSVGDRHYRMKAVFYRAAFASEQQGEGEHDLYWLEEKEVAASFFLKCHKWAVNQIKH